MWCSQINFWCLMFWRQIWCWLGCCFFLRRFLSFWDENKLNSRFLKSFYQFLSLICVWLSFQTKEALFAALRLSFYINYNRRLHLMAIFCSVSDSTRFNEGNRALLDLLIEAFDLYETSVKLDVIWCWKRQQSDVNETDPNGNTGWY